MSGREDSEEDNSMGALRRRTRRTRRTKTHTRLTPKEMAREQLLSHS
jgi:hypothetical protein